ncbi:transcriptional regulator [Kribbella amoyensis]|uniref:transcriptional regulator n=1 Tax=Kribbella amoyensis TaxID=996641 RepID=UPI0011A6217F|nr:transcriptional regulator [Kribbella amoyensis]
MYEESRRSAALAALRSGESLSSVSRRLGPSRATLRAWREEAPRDADPTACPRCTGRGLDSASYAHLIGLYLGDGCLSKLAKGVYSLRIACDTAYPRLISEATESIVAVHPTRPVHLTRAAGCTQVTSYWKHWPCLFPQHGAGPKHLRLIELADWQREIVAGSPERFVRGLFDSDGCRVLNWTGRQVAGQTKRYEYPRYLFSNSSGDIMRCCQWALDLLEIPWRMPRPTLLSVARREAVAALDRFVGPKT